MRTMLIIELLSLPGLLWLLVVWRKAGQLRPSRLALVIAAYGSLLSTTLFEAYAGSSTVRLVGAVVSLLLLPILYLLTKAVAQRLLH